jgi:hypothetical protein
MSGAGPANAPQAWVLLEQAIELSRHSTLPNRVMVDPKAIIWGDEHYVINILRNTMDQHRTLNLQLPHARVTPMQNPTPIEIVQNRSASMHIRSQDNPPPGPDGITSVQWRERW